MSIGKNESESNTSGYECDVCNYHELWQRDYIKWMKKCIRCQKPQREGWLIRREPPARYIRE